MLVYQRVHDFPITTSIYGGFPSLQCLMTPEAMETLETLFFAAFLLGISWLTHFRKRLVDPTFWSDRVHLAGEKRIMRMVLWTVFGVFFAHHILGSWLLMHVFQRKTWTPPQPPATTATTEGHPVPLWLFSDEVGTTKAATTATATLAVSGAGDLGTLGDLRISWSILDGYPLVMSK